MAYITIKGLETVLNNLNIPDDQLIAGMEAAKLDLANKIEEITVNSVPLDEGTLRRSFTTNVQDGKVTAGYNTEYALYQHQGVNQYGNKFEIYSHPDTGPFFLTAPVKANLDKLRAFFLERIKAITKT